jgi:hypothetical protein
LVGIGAGNNLAVLIASKKYKVVNLLPSSNPGNDDVFMHHRSFTGLPVKTAGPTSEQKAATIFYEKEGKGIRFLYMQGNLYLIKNLYMEPTPGHSLNLAPPTAWIKHTNSFSQLFEMIPYPELCKKLKLANPRKKNRMGKKKSL